MLDVLKQRISQLVAAYEKEKAERIRLSNELEHARQENDTYKEQIIELKRQIDNGDNADSKKKIDRLIKEIDKCISLMEG